MRMTIALMLICMSGAVSAQMTLKDEQRLADIERAQAAINNLDATLTLMLKKREADCRKAIGYAPFCGCVMEELPVAWSFSDYIAITTQSKEESGYANLKPDMKAAYDKVGPIRDRCVAKINGKK